MNLTQTELQRLLELVSESDMHTTNCSSIENLFVKLSVEFAKKTIEKDPIVETKDAIPLYKDSLTYKIYKAGDSKFTSSTTETARKLHVTQSDLRVLRNTNELREKLHYETGRSPRPTAIWYDLNRTCIQLHEVTWETFSKPGFDVQANTDRKVARAFERARRNQKK
tara:strand:+ start:60 stop:560 length:501 start_codon:yes stop_codon:yes gene_type:complete